MANVLRGAPHGAGLRVGVAVGRFNEPVTERLLQGALAALADAGVAAAAVTVAWVPGAFELPQCCQWFATSGRCDAVVALGAVIRGDTDHYDYVCRAAADGVLRVNLDTGVPVAFGVLTCDSLDQALDRAGGKAGNKGTDAVLAALEMAALRRILHAVDPAQKGPSGR
jgi:6,7-dimethyl-8-ribityllumazine synthase